MLKPLKVDVEELTYYLSNLHFSYTWYVLFEPFVDFLKDLH